MMKKIWSSILAICLFSCTALAQTQYEVEMADSLRASGMIYVVVAVVGTILIGLLIYLFSMDKRIRKIENQN